MKKRKKVKERLRSILSVCLIVMMVSTVIDYPAISLVYAEETETEESVEESVTQEMMAEETVKEEINIFSQSQTVDGVVITVTADAGVFPEGAVLAANMITDASMQEQIENAIEETSGVNQNPEKSLVETKAFDISILDSEGNELQPDSEKGEVHVVFSRIDELNLGEQNSLVQVYHMDDTLTTAEELDTNVNLENNTAEVVADHFSTYVLAVTSNSTSSFNIEEGSVSITTSGEYLIYGTKTTCHNRITISGDIDVTVTLRDVYIDKKEESYLKDIAFAVVNGARATVKLAGENTIIGGFNQAGMKVETGNTLTITSADGDGATTGKLTVKGSGTGGYCGGAGIGAGGAELYTETTTFNPGTIIINGGTIEAYGYDGGAGIGGTYQTNGGSVTINGGSVRAEALSSVPKATGGAGIGGGFEGYLDTITITGGNVWAQGRLGSSGIGTGIGADNGTDITISGGNITVYPSEEGAASIGNYPSDDPDYYESEGSITITGGELDLHGGAISPAPIGYYYEMKFQIYDARITSDLAIGSEVKVTLGNGDEAKEYSGSWSAGTYSATVEFTVITPLTGTQPVKIVAGDLTYDTQITMGDTNITIGEELVPLDLKCYASEISIGQSYAVSGWKVTRQNGTTLNATDDTKIKNMVLPSAIDVTAGKTGVLHTYLPASEGYSISCKVASLNSNNAITKDNILHTASEEIVFFEGEGVSKESMAEEMDISYGDITFEMVDGAGKITFYDSQGNMVECTSVDSDQTYTIMQSASGEVAHHIVIKDWENAKICLAGINIKNAYSSCTMRLNSASVTLNLKEGTKNQISNDNYYAAIGVDASSSLTIEGEGSLTASSKYSAVIGSPYDNEAVGDITIHSGTITAKGEYSVGIGSYQSSFGIITITGGKVTAEGRVGIGTFANRISGLFGKINISGGEVEAKGNSASGIGIPSGVRCEISGGTVKAGPGTLKSQLLNVSGIGNGGEGFSSDYFGTLKISGGSVTVKKNCDGVGIGVDCNYPVSNKIVICGGTVSGDSINGDIKDEDGNIVYNTTVDLSKAYSQPNTALSSVDKITKVTYGLKDVKTDDAKKIYIYLPKNNDGEKTYGSFGEMNYRGTIDANNDNQLERYISLTKVSVSSKTDVTASVHVTSDTDGVVYYAVSNTELTSGEAVKSAAEAGNGAIGAGRAICAKGAVTNCELEGLTANTSYKAYFASCADGIYSDV